MYQTDQDSFAARHFFSAIFFLIIIFVVQEVGASLMQISVDGWFIALKKPTWNPPAWVFRVVWPILYVIVAFVGYMFWTQPKSPARNLGLFFWGLQLFFNTIWTYCFFTLKSPFLGFVDILLVIVCSLCVIYYGRKVSYWIVYSFIPYVLWLGYAAALNLAIVLMN